MPPPPKKTKTTVRLLEAFLDRPTDEIHGFDLVAAKKIKSGTLYPLLIRLENLGWLESRWEESDRPGPRRRLYRLTAVGEQAAREYVEAGRNPDRLVHGTQGFDGTPRGALA